MSSQRTRLLLSGGLCAALAALVPPSVTHAQTLAVGLSEVVRGGLSTDAWGEASTPTTFARGELHIQLPRGARVRHARLYSGFTVYYPNASLPPWPPVIPAGPTGSPRVVIVGSGATAITRTLEGTPRYFSSTVPTAGVTAWWGTFVTEVTAAVRAAVGPSSRGGQVNVPVAERGDDAAREGPSVIQFGGHFLVVVYELDFGPRRNVVLYEGCATNGYTTESLPLPGAVANRCPTSFPRGEPFAASVGVMWEFNRRPGTPADDPTRDTCSEEESEIFVNGTSLTTRAGGSDDWPSVPAGMGCFGNTAGLVTMGSFGGTEPGPGRAAGSPVGLEGDEILTRPTLPRLDDELYDFRTVVNDNATSIRFRFRGDNDEMIPVIAFQTLARGSATDADGDSWSDADEGDCTVDTDNDGTPDYLDTDSDNDCLPDQRETAAGRTNASVPGRPDLNCPATAPVCDTVAGVCLCNVTSDCTRAPEAPVCDAATRTCVACTSDPQCAAIDPGTPACFTASGTLRGRCVVCTTDAHCPTAAPRCNTATATCVACASNADCPDPARPACDATSRTCRPCATATVSTDCRDPARPACATSGSNAGRCVPCVSDRDCRAGSCDLTTNTCVGCRTNADCAGSQPICDATRRVCRPCDPAVSTDCSAPTPACATTGPNAGRCVACTTSNASACTGDTPACDPNTNTCVRCTPGPSGDARACATSPDGPVCVAGSPPACGCNVDSDCGAADSGRICDPTNHRCRPGCWPGDGHNTCPRGEACSSVDPMVPGTCAVGCYRDLDCGEGTPRCLRPGDVGVGRCVGCVDDSQCAGRPDGRGRCDPNTNTCVRPPDNTVGEEGCNCHAASPRPSLHHGVWLIAGLLALARLRRRRSPRS